MENKEKGTLEKIVLAGMGTMALTAEKSKELLDELVEKGKLTFEQGKVINEELKHKIKAKASDADKVVKDTLDELVRKGELTVEQA